MQLLNQNSISGVSEPKFHRISGGTTNSVEDLRVSVSRWGYSHRPDFRDRMRDTGWSLSGAMNSPRPKW